jgi:RNA polymerase sigma factor (sigma-70 family)
VTNDKDSKNYFIVIDGEKVPVSEEVYRAFKRPAWTERKRRQIRAEHERSLEAFAEDGFDIPSDDALVDEIVADKLLLDMLMSALDKLTDDERDLIDALFFEDKSERTVAAERGVQRNTIVYHKNKILAKLRQILENF